MYASLRSNLPTGIIRIYLENYHFRGLEKGLNLPTKLFKSAYLPIKDQLMGDVMLLPYSYKFSRVLIFARIRTETPNSAKFYTINTRSIEVRENKSA